jgi:hypothetical protein
VSSGQMNTPGGKIANLRTGRTGTWAVRGTKWPCRGLSVKGGVRENL